MDEAVVDLGAAALYPAAVPHVDDNLIPAGIDKSLRLDSEVIKRLHPLTGELLDRFYASRRCCGQFGRRHGLDVWVRELNNRVQASAIHRLIGPAHYLHVLLGHRYS